MVSRAEKNIVFVEDDAKTRGATKAMLRRLGYRVRAETEGLRALILFSKQPLKFDIALVDHGMSDLTGLELAARLRRIRPDFPVLVYTDYTDRPSSQQMEAAGVCENVVIKPASMKEMKSALQQALRTHH